MPTSSTVIQIGIADVSGALTLFELSLPLVDFFDEAIKFFGRFCVILPEFTVHCIVRLVNPFSPVLALTELAELFRLLRPVRRPPAFGLPLF